MMKVLTLSLTPFITELAVEYLMCPVSQIASNGFGIFVDRTADLYITVLFTAIVSSPHRKRYSPVHSWYLTNPCDRYFYLIGLKLSLAQLGTGKIINWIDGATRRVF